MPLRKHAGGMFLGTRFEAAVLQGHSILRSKSDIPHSPPSEKSCRTSDRIFRLYYSFLNIQYSSFIKQDFSMNN